MHSAPAVNLRGKPALILIPHSGAAAVLLSFECASVRADVLILIYHDTFRILRRIRSM